LKPDFLRTAARPRSRFSFASVVEESSDHSVAPNHSSARCLDTHCCKLKRYPVDRLAAISQLAKQWEIVERTGLRLLTDRTNLSLPRGVRKSMRTWVGVAEFSAASLRCRKCGLRAFGNQTRLVFGHGRENVDREAIRQRHVGCDKIYAALHQAGDHRSAAGQPIKPCDYELGVIDPAKPKRFRKFWSATVPAALELGQLSEHFASVGSDVAPNGVLLRQKAEP
jgi:hypothetical protein